MSFSQPQLGAPSLAFPPPPPPENPPSSSTENAAPVPARAPYPHIRSCLACRQRKVRCDRQHPCSNCSRFATECIFPPGPGRAPKRPRGTRDARLQERLWRLENLVQSLGAELGSAGQAPKEGAKESTNSSNESASISHGELHANTSIEQEFGRLLIRDKRSCYVGNRLWASLADEIEELRDLLDQPCSEENEYPWQPAFIDQPDPSSEASLLGYHSVTRSLRNFHPPFSQQVLLFQTFQENVAPLVRVFHMPSLSKMFWDCIPSLDSLKKDDEALLFSIYYAAIISLSPEQCESRLGEPRPTTITKYRFAVEQALARANLLNTQNAQLIQAAVLFLSALRNEDDSRTVWSMTALIFHLAQAIGLHRDGTAFGLRPFETEIRRRIWWHICLLDARSSEDHGCEPIVHDAVFDTRLPLNVNDSDLSPEMTEFPEEKEGATEMTFCLIRCEVTRTMRRIGYVPPSLRGSGHQQDGLPVEDRRKLTNELKQLLEERYLRHCGNESIPIFLASATVARLILARMWLAVNHPMSQADSTPSNARDRAFLASIEVVQLSALLLTCPSLLKWNWYFRTHIQWHAMAFVLSELCSRPPSPNCDRAWIYVTALYNGCEAKDKDRKGNLSRPISRLMSKARQVREMQEAGARALGIVPFNSNPATVPADTGSLVPESDFKLPATTPGGVTIPSTDTGTPMEIPPDPLFGALDSFAWSSNAPTNLEAPANFQPLVFDPGTFTAFPPEANNVP